MGTAENEFGEELRRAREARGIPLEAIAAATKISLTHLKELEAGRFEKLPAPIFVRGFLRAYAHHLGLDADQLINAYLAAGGQPAAATALVSPAPRPEHGRIPSRTIAIWAISAGIVGLLVAGYFLRPARRGDGVDRVPVAATPVPPHLVVASGAAGASGPRASGPTGAADIQPLSLEISVTGDCWSEIVADGESIFAGILHAGEARRYTARQAFLVTIGNVAVAHLTVDGRPVPVSGRPGEVLHQLRIDRDYVRSLGANPRP